MCSFTWLGDDSQVITPAFGKVIGLIICKRKENERNYFTRANFKTFQFGQDQDGRKFQPEEYIEYFED